MDRNAGRDYYGRKHLGKIQAIDAMAGLAGTAIGPALINVRLSLSPLLRCLVAECSAALSHRSDCLRVQIGREVTGSFRTSTLACFAARRLSVFSERWRMTGPVFYFLSVLPACIAVIEVLFLSKPAKKSTIESVYAAPARP